MANDNAVRSRLIAHFSAAFNPDFVRPPARSFISSHQDADASTSSAPREMSCCLFVYFKFLIFTDISSSSIINDHQLMIESSLLQLQKRAPASTSMSMFAVISSLLSPVLSPAWQSMYNLWLLVNWSVLYFAFYGAWAGYKFFTVVCVIIESVTFLSQSSHKVGIVIEDNEMPILINGFTHFKMNWKQTRLYY